MAATTESLVSPRIAALRSAMTHQASAALLREFVTRRLFGQVAGLLDGPDTDLRVNLAAGALIGVATLRHALRVEPLASAPVEDLVDRMTPVLSLYLGTATVSPAKD